jgi:hypothetical protein
VEESRVRRREVDEGFEAVDELVERVGRVDSGARSFKVGWVMLISRVFRWRMTFRVYPRQG